MPGEATRGITVYNLTQDKTLPDTMSGTTGPSITGGRYTVVISPLQVIPSFPHLLTKEET